MNLFGLQFGALAEDDLTRLRAARPTYDHIGPMLSYEQPLRYQTALVHA